MSGGEQLIQMANDIGNFFRAEPLREDAITGIVNHISKYWTRRMREKLIGEIRHGTQGLDELPRAALERLIQAADVPLHPVPAPDSGPCPT